MVVTWEMNHLDFVQTHSFGTVGNDWRVLGTHGTPEPGKISKTESHD